MEFDRLQDCWDSSMSTDVKPGTFDQDDSSNCPDSLQEDSDIDKYLNDLHLDTPESDLSSDEELEERTSSMTEILTMKATTWQNSRLHFKSTLRSGIHTFEDSLPLSFMAPLMMVFGSSLMAHASPCNRLNKLHLTSNFQASTRWR